MQETTSKILYVRAAIRPLKNVIQQAGGIINFLNQYFAFDEIFVPYFSGARPFWRPASKLPRATNSGALGKMIAKYQDAFISQHPSHSFAGVGPRVIDILKRHNYNKSCFYPISCIAEQHDFSMLLLACVEDSPGFSTVHAVQHELGLTQKHLIRYILRWDIEFNKIQNSIIARESPGCSSSFNKFYPFYKNDGNFIQQELFGKSYIFIQSARRAMTTERKILSINPRFVDCGRLMCDTCRLRFY